MVCGKAVCNKISTLIVVDPIFKAIDGQANNSERLLFQTDWIFRGQAFYLIIVNRSLKVLLSRQTNR